MNPASLIGVLTPQANTTVEAEFWTLLPPDWSLINGRLTSTAGSIEARLRDYADTLESSCAQFANAPVRSIAFACTGASYLIGAPSEHALAQRIGAGLGMPLVTAAQAVVAALRTLGATRIALVSPYPEALTAESAGYWRGQGFEVEAIRPADTAAGAFHPIYAMPTDAALAPARALRTTGAHAIVLLGTGMPTLATLDAMADGPGAPVLSVNLALAWAATGGESGPMPLAGWLAGSHWRPRLRLLFPSLAAAPA